jgi:hypothetical protein
MAQEPPTVDFTKLFNRFFLIKRVEYFAFKLRMLANDTFWKKGSWIFNAPPDKLGRGRDRNHESHQPGSLDFGPTLKTGY